MKQSDFKDIIRKELAVSKVNGDSLFKLIDEYDREKLVHSFWSRFMRVEDALVYIRDQSNWDTVPHD